MADRIRTFVAIEIPLAPLRDVLEELAAIGRPVRLVDEPLHLTLKFLGDTDRAVVERLSSIVEEVCFQTAVFETQLFGLGAFPRRERPAVVWAGVSPAEPLATLAANLETRLEPLGFARESRTFAPHVTLARIKGRSPQALAELLELYDSEAFGEVPITAVRYYESTLTPRGPRYSVLSTARLNDSAP